MSKPGMTSASTDINCYHQGNLGNLVGPSVAIPHVVLVLLVTKRKSIKHTDFSEIGIGSNISTNSHVNFVCDANIERIFNSVFRISNYPQIF